MREHIQTVSLQDAAYPQALLLIADPPKMLYYIGDITLTSRPCVAIVGSRRASEYGKWAAFQTAKKLSCAGIVVVSGMAEGCDSFAHRGALEGSTPTVAVLGCGPDICYPRSAVALRERILFDGLLLSEYPPGMRPSNFTFPARNRIISGISMSTVVAEAGNSSGSLITAERAAAQGREVYAIPGNINRLNSIGTNKLIRDGARPLVIIDDLLTDLGLNPQPDAAILDLSPVERLVYQTVLEGGELSVGEAAARNKLSVHETAAVVTRLEIKGYICYESGKIFIANEQMSLKI